VLHTAAALSALSKAEADVLSLLSTASRTCKLLAQLSASPSPKSKAAVEASTAEYYAKLSGVHKGLAPLARLASRYDERHPPEDPTGRGGVGGRVERQLAGEQAGLLRGRPELPGEGKEGSGRPGGKRKR
jgi:hypothetical protein